MKVEIQVPPLSESLASGTLLAWHKQVGDQVTRDEILVDLETDKVILEIPAPASGYASRHKAELEALLQDALETVF